jgi:hypothetical protein
VVTRPMNILGIHGTDSTVLAVGLFQIIDEIHTWMLSSSTLLLGDINYLHEGSYDKETRSD